MKKADQDLNKDIKERQKEKTIINKIKIEVNQ